MVLKTVRWLSYLILMIVLMAEPTRAENAFNFTFDGFDGDPPIVFKQFEGKAVLVVNTATRCGFSYQFEQLEKLWRQHQEDGLVVVGVPSNDFKQEPLHGKQISNYCKQRYGVTFPLAERTEVTGPTAHPFYKWAASQSGTTPQWNFHKYVIGRDGRIVASLPSQVEPNSAELSKAIDAALQN